MTWQRKARLGIALFVAAFVVVVFLAVRRQDPARSVEPPPAQLPPNAVAHVTGGLKYDHFRDGKVLFSIRADTQSVFPDGRTVYTKAVLELPERNGRTVHVAADEADVTIKQGTDVGTALLKGNVRLTTSDGTQVNAGEATYTSADGVLKIPGPVTFAKGRLSGSGVGATYDQNREVLWLLDRARLAVAPDATGQGALEATAGAAGLASSAHYAQLTRGGRITSEGRLIEADDITIQLTDDNERVRLLELRANSRITGASASAQSMSARDIDLTYAADGRTLQAARLVDNAVVQLPGDGKAPGRRIAGRTIDMTLAPDGATLTSLVANENVQLELPPEPGAPARRITAARLEASGAAGAGLQSGVFTGNVEYREIRPAGSGAAASERTARSDRLVVETSPGLGTIQQADFRGHVRITDGPEVTAQAARALYRVTDDRMDLSPGSGDPGPQAQVSDARATVVARTIQLTLGTRSMLAETDVRSTLKPSPRTPADGRDTRGQLPSMLNDDEPVNVTANRLDYDGATSVATYTGNATLWQQDGNRIQAAAIVIDDRNGNLTAREDVRTFMNMTDVDAKTKQKKTTRTSGRAELFVYDDAKRQATYTTKAVLDGPQGLLTADVIELFLAKETNDLQRAEADGNVTIREGQRVARGTHLTYTAASEEYVLTGAVGTPVTVVDDKPSGCEHTTGTRLVFQRNSENLSMANPVSRPCRPGDPR